MRSCLLAFLLAFIVASHAKFNYDNPKEFGESILRNEFDSWALEHGKVYQTVNEKQMRFANFKASIERVAKFNARTAAMGVGATYGLNQFSDLSPEEFSDTVLSRPFNPPDHDTKIRNLMASRWLAAPDTFDWRPKGAVTDIKDQAQCGSCWAFSVIENVESVWMLAKGISNVTMTRLSAQQIVDCDTSDEGCNGGNPETAYEYIKSAGGLESEKDYPYTAVDGTCRFKKAEVFAQISNYKYATTSGDETTLKTNLATWAPLSICVDARYWQDYQGGVMTAYECDWIVELDHCVQAVGYDLTASTPFWIVRNSWGTTWGEAGYIRLEYGQNSCGLTEEATSAVV